MQLFLFNINNAKRQQGEILANVTEVGNALKNEINRHYIYRQTDRQAGRDRYIDRYTIVLERHRANVLCFSMQIVYVLTNDIKVLAISMTANICDDGYLHPCVALEPHHQKRFMISQHLLNLRPSWQQ
jgi:hypothetical protein